MKHSCAPIRVLLLAAFAAFASLALSGCALTRVSDARHAREVEGLHAVGFTLAQARAIATQNGFACEQQPETNLSVQTKTGVRKSTVLVCNKSSAELICPQRRYVVFNLDPESGKVYAVGQRITQQSCF